ncbi:DUF4230 domain-containing protein [Roseivirga pacifica]|uniref:DUF4230 domain-containing protein n=1 Tax=Roseivirga pacifica TaxID=1267423 RepID=UPI0020954523|nr:DUF4230 domain-containing protein [Roseivirga pacifica]MCO6358753.1 DUF4230 domain-containing protein [Roseivirga pacifica]MCO6365611.1 DUF4230 domain-containing protein [Roseivirga pacifica]MCO6371659.1 DUF4230 domain-containing protein [Roseivirga pacifica]MCO6376230.1 DUF4230 domain-containing protein [Roseivirga pacifica]MCO6379037.1 DUF4230 domain-containing protein [Roseivirga pacifica]
MSNPTQEKVSFLSNHQPALDSGDYTVTVEQKRGNIPGDTSPTFTTTKTIFVAGERFTIPKSKVYSSFPPPASLGDYSSDLPHIMLTRSTLPWERFAQSGKKSLPWLFLFVFDDNDIKAGNVKVSTATIGDTIKLTDPVLPPTNASDTINLKKETGDSALEGNKLNTIEINSYWAKNNKILPDTEDLFLMTGVRVNSDATAITTVSTPEGVTEMAICIANRLPTQGVKSYAHLLSLENRFSSEARAQSIVLNQDSATDTYTSFISLTDWSFTCLADSGESFSELLNSVDQGGLNLPGIGHTTADQYLSRGAVALPHHLKEGGETVSWYHGPLVSGDSPDNNQDLYKDNVIQSSDDLLRLDSDLGMLDTSYAAAWELGRMLTLNNKDMAMKIYAWKRQQSWSQQQVQNDLFHNLLPTNVSEAKVNAQSEQWAQIQAWLKSLNLLEDVPFNYLIPDEKLLPEESIRFFELDNFWISCLMDGAYSVGRVTQTEAQRDHDTKNSYSPGNYEKMSGFLLRSKAVSGWPGLMVEAPTVKPTTTAPTPDGHQLLRMDRLAPDILLCLFEGEAQYFDIHLKPESIHFGFTPHPGDMYTKDIKFSFQTNPATETAKIAWANSDSSNRVVDLTALKANIDTAINNANTGANSNLNPAQFAMNMVQGVPKVVFDKGTAKTVTEDAVALGTDETEIANEMQTSKSGSVSLGQNEGGGSNDGNKAGKDQGSDDQSAAQVVVPDESAKDKVEGWIEHVEEKPEGHTETSTFNEKPQTHSTMDQDNTKTSDLEKVIEKLEGEFPKASADLKDFLKHKKEKEQGLDPKEKGTLKYEVKKVIAEIKDLEPEVTDEVKEKLDEIKDKIESSPLLNMNSAKVRKAWVVGTLILLAVSTIIWIVSTIIDRERPQPLVLHFQGVKEMQEIEFVKQDYDELVPIATKDGELEFLLTVPATVSGKMDMTMMEYEVEGDTVIKVTLPDPIVSDPVLNLGEVEDYYDRGGGDKLFLSGGGASYNKAYEQIISAMEETKKGILANAVKNDIIDQTNKKARAYLINMAAVTGYRIEFVLKEPDPTWEDDMKKRLGKTYDKVKHKVEGHTGLFNRIKDDLTGKKSDNDTKTESK